MKRCIYFSLVFSILSFGGFIFADNPKNIQDIDFLDMASHYKNGILTVSLLYKNRDTDQLVFWREGSITCNYVIYEYSDDDKKGSKILEGSKVLTRHAQDFYIDIPSSYLKDGSRGFIECEININGKPLIASNIIWF